MSASHLTLLFENQFRQSLLSFFFFRFSANSRTLIDTRRKFLVPLSIAHPECTTIKVTTTVPGGRSNLSKQRQKAFIIRNSELRILFFFFDSV